MIIAFATDTHGRVDLYEQLADLVLRTRADALILGGDMLPDGDMKSPCEAQVGFALQYLTQWLQRLRDRRPECRVATVFGNHDWLCSSEIAAKLETEGLLTVLRPDRVVSIGSWRVLGYSNAPPSPFWAKDYERLDRVGDKPPLADGVYWDQTLQSIAKTPTDYFLKHPTIQEDLARLPLVEPPWIFVAHAPPFGTGLDLLISGEAVGSRAVLDFIRQRQPTISLHGHLHDSPFRSGRYYAVIDRTIAVNPGQGTQTLAAVTFDPDDVPDTLTGYGIRLPQVSR